MSGEGPARAQAGPADLARPGLAERFLEVRARITSLDTDGAQRGLDEIEVMLGTLALTAASPETGVGLDALDELTEIGNILLAAGKGPAHDHEMCAGCDSDEEIIGEAASRVGRLLAALSEQRPDAEGGRA